MAIVKEWTCPGHGDFESAEPRCPKGCSVVAEREFRTAPAYHNGTTKRTDDLVRGQVEAFGLSNIRSARQGETARIQTPAEKRQAEFQQAIRNKYPSNWGAVPKEGGVPAVLGAYNAPAGQAIDKEALAQHKPKVTVIRDHENLKVDVKKAAAQ